MNALHILSLQPSGHHNSLREGVRLGLILASATWLWVALVDALAGQPSPTFAALGGIGAFTVMHFLLNIAYAVVIVAAVHSADHAPSVIIAVMFGALTVEGGIAMVTNLLAQAALGSVAWIEILGGSLIATGIAIVLLTRTHPLATYLRRAAEET